MVEEVRERVILAHRTNDIQDFTIELFLDYQTDDGEWVGVCEQLGVAANADALDDAKEILKDLVLLQLSGVDGLGNINGYLAENGVVIMKPERSRNMESGFILTTADAGVYLANHRTRSDSFTGTKWLDD